MFDPVLHFSLRRRIENTRIIASRELKLSRFTLFTFTHFVVLREIKPFGGLLLVALLFVAK